MERRRHRPAMCWDADTQGDLQGLKRVADVLGFEPAAHEGSAPDVKTMSGNLQTQEQKNPEPVTRITRGPGDTRRLARQLLRRLPDGVVLALYGDLGSGKTCFVQGLAEGLGICEPVTSPTFTLAHEYRGRRPLRHVDLYRIASEDEALQMGIEEYLGGDGITAIEWAERMAGLLPEETLHISFRPGEKPSQRLVTISPDPPSTRTGEGPHA